MPPSNLSQHTAERRHNAGENAEGVRKFEPGVGTTLGQKCGSFPTPKVLANRDLARQRCQRWTCFSFPPRLSPTAPT